MFFFGTTTTCGRQGERAFNSGDFLGMSWKARACSDVRQAKPEERRTDKIAAIGCHRCKHLLIRECSMATRYLD